MHGYTNWLKTNTRAPAPHLRTEAPRLQSIRTKLHVYADKQQKYLHTQTHTYKFLCVTYTCTNTHTYKLTW